MVGFLGIDDLMIEMQRARYPLHQGRSQNGVKIGAVTLAGDVGSAVIGQAFALIECTGQQSSGFVMEEGKAGGRQRMG